jgi:hypothetical protein
MMNQRLQAKYMTVLEDMYVRDSYTLADIRDKHRINQYFLIAVKKLGYVKKVEGKRLYTWNSGSPTKRHLNRIKTELMTIQLKKVSKRQPKAEPPRKTIVKLFWGLITYEK